MFKVQNTLFAKIAIILDVLIILGVIFIPLFQYLSVALLDNEGSSVYEIMFFVAFSIFFYAIDVILKIIPTLILFGVYFFKYPNGLKIDGDNVIVTMLFFKSRIPINQINFTTSKTMFARKDYYVMLYANKRKNKKLVHITFKNLDEFVSIVNNYNDV